MYIFAGEDLPDTRLEEDSVRTLTDLAEKTGDADIMQKINESIASGKINKTNVAAYEARLHKLIDNPKKED